MAMRVFGRSEIAVWTFFGKSEEGYEEKVGVNGLPLAPASIRILGRFQQLRTLLHPHLTRYLDLQRGKYERLFLVEESHPFNLKQWLISEHPNLNNESVCRIAWQVAKGLEYLHDNQIIHRQLSLKNVHLVPPPPQSCVVNIPVVRLSHFGLFHITHYGNDVDFTVGDPWYLPPEVLARYPKRLSASECSPKSDIWSFGILLLEIACGCALESVWKCQQWFRVLFSVIRKAQSDSVLSLLLEAVKMAKPHISIVLSDEMEILLSRCLNVDPKQRPSMKELLENSPLSQFSTEFPLETPFMGLDSIFRCCNRTKHITPQEFRRFAELTVTRREWEEWPIGERPIDEVYLLWRLAGPSAETILKQKGYIKSVAPIKALPYVVVGECDIFGNESNRHYLTDLNVVVLSQENLVERLRSVELEDFYPSLEQIYGGECGEGGGGNVSTILQTGKDLPVLVKERDIGYQLERMILFESLLHAYPMKADLLWREAKTDIPPLYRGHVWAGLLGVKSDVDLVYGVIDKESPTPTDRQIEVDIPRCHQYDELLSSPTGHVKLKRILKAWVHSNPEYVYWQGLDSLCAPFLYLHFNNEALAFSCLHAFIPRYLHKFFLYDNAPVIQEYLAVFSHLIAFHDPQLNSHLVEIDFFPELYAIPWFLTMFAHVFPLHKLFHLWDTLLLGDHSFPLCVGVAILDQLRHRLLHYGFNECILLFSDLPEIDIERCVIDSVHFFIRTPKSVLYRQHAPPRSDPKSGKRRSTRGGSFTLYGTQLHKTLSSQEDVIENNELRMSPVPLIELKAATCPQISAEELMELSNGNTSPSQTQGGWDNQMGTVFPLDIRCVEEYEKGTYCGSWNLPFHSVDLTQDPLSLPPTPASHKLQAVKGVAIIVVFGNQPQHMLEFSMKLVGAGYSRVCTLHGGVDVFRKANLLTIPTPVI